MGEWRNLYALVEAALQNGLIENDEEEAKSVCHKEIARRHRLGKKTQKKRT